MDDILDTLDEGLGEGGYDLLVNEVKNGTLFELVHENEIVMIGEFKNNRLNGFGLPIDPAHHEMAIFVRDAITKMVSVQSVEMDEVYRKAEAFDQLAHTYEQYKESHTHDLKSTMGTKAIELLEADG